MRAWIFGLGVLVGLSSCKVTSLTDTGTSSSRVSQEEAPRSLASVGFSPRFATSATPAPAPSGSDAFSRFLQGQTKLVTCPAPSGTATGGGEGGCIQPPDAVPVNPDFGILLPAGVDGNLTCSEVTLEIGQSATLTTLVGTTPSSYASVFDNTALLFTYVSSSPLQTTGLAKHAITVRATNVTVDTRVVVTSELGWNVPGQGQRRIHCDHIVNIKPPAPPVPPPHGSLACVTDATSIMPGAVAHIGVTGKNLTDPTSYSYDSVILENIGSLTATGSGLTLQAMPTVLYSLPQSDRTLVVTAVSRDAYGELRATCPAIVVNVTPRPPTTLSCFTSPTLGANDKSYDFVVQASSDATSVRLAGLAESPQPTAPSIPGKAELIPVSPGNYILRYTAAFSKMDTEFRAQLEADGNTHATAVCVGTKTGNPYGPENGWIEPPSFVSCYSPQPVITLPGGSGFALVTKSGGWVNSKLSVSAVAPHDVDLLAASGGYLVKLHNPAEWKTGDSIHVTTTYGKASDTCHFALQSGDGGSIPPPQYPVVQCDTQNLLLQTHQTGLLQYESKGQTKAPTLSLSAVLASDGKTPYNGALGKTETIAVGDTTTVKYTTMDTLAADLVVTVKMQAQSGNADCTVRVSREVNLGVPDDGKTVGLVGNVWALPANTNNLSVEPPNTAPLMTVVMDTPRVYDRAWSDGFPGVAVNSLPANHGHCTMITDKAAPDYGKCRLDEWFQIRFRGVMLLTQSGRHCFQTQSDDGIAFRVDGSEVFAYRPIHAPTWNEFCVDLAAGAHDVILDYMQGPRVRIACAMKVKFPGSSSFIEAPPSMWARGLGN